MASSARHRVVAKTTNRLQPPPPPPSSSFQFGTIHFKSFDNGDHNNNDDVDIELTFDAPQWCDLHSVEAMDYYTAHCDDDDDWFATAHANHEPKEPPPPPKPLYIPSPEKGTPTTSSSSSIKSKSHQASVEKFMTSILTPSRSATSLLHTPARRVPSSSSSSTTPLRRQLAFNTSSSSSSSSSSATASVRNTPISPPHSLQHVFATAASSSSSSKSKTRPPPKAKRRSNNHDHDEDEEDEASHDGDDDDKIHLSPETQELINEHNSRVMNNNHKDIDIVLAEHNRKVRAATATTTTTNNNHHNNTSSSIRRRRPPARSTTAARRIMADKENIAVQNARGRTRIKSKTVTTTTTTTSRRPRPGNSNNHIKAACEKIGFDNASEIADIVNAHNQRILESSRTYEPCLHSVRDIRKYESLTGRKWNQLNKDEQREANRAISHLKHTGQLT